MPRDRQPVVIHIVASSQKSDIFLECPKEDLYHFARRPSAWVRAVCTWIVGCDGRLEVSTDDQASGDDKIYDSVDLTSDAVWPCYKFTPKPTDDRPEAVVNLADIRKRGAQSASHSSCAPSQVDTKETIRERDGQKCIFTQRYKHQQAHIVPFRVQCKGRWKTLSACFGDIDINSAENIISLENGLHQAIDDDFCFAILPLGPLLSDADVHPQTENPPWPYDANDPDTTASTAFLLHYIPSAAVDETSPASKKQKIEKTEEELKKERKQLEDRREHERKVEEQYRAVYPHNLRPRFRNEALAPPKREVLEYRYATAILKRYGTDDTRTMLDQDWNGPLGHIHKHRDQDEDDDDDDEFNDDETDGDYRDGSDQDDHDESNGQGPATPNDSPPTAKQPRGSAPRRTAARINRSGLDQAFNMMYNITRHLYVAPLEEKVKLKEFREREEKQAAVQHWVDSQSTNPPL